MIKKNINRESFVDIIKVVSIFMVVITHCLSGYRNVFQKVGGAFFLDCGVPFFLILTGYNYANSCCRNDILTFRQWYSKKNLLKRLYRIIIPTLIVMILIILFFLIRTSDGFFEIISNLIQTGFGPGFYYVALLFQIVLLFPILLFGYKKSKFITVTMVFVLNVLYELAFSHNYIPNQTFYSITILRQLVFLLMGVVLLDNKVMSKMKKI